MDFLTRHAAPLAQSHVPRHDGTTPSHPELSWTQPRPLDPSKSGSRANGYHAPDTPQTSMRYGDENSQPGYNRAPSPIYKSVAEARKKAQAAILNLWPLEVRYQNYVDEDINETLLGSLFDDIGMPKTLSKVSNGVRHAKGVLDPQNRAENPSQSSNHKDTAMPNSKAIQSSYVANKPEQPPDVSAVLAERNKQQLSNTPLGSTASASTTVPALAKPTVSAEKERLLKMKMDALRKSREERAQKAAAKNNSNTSTTVVETQAELLKQADTSEPSPLSSGSPLPLTTKPQRSPSLAPDKKAQPSQVTQQPVIPGLFLASSAASPVPPTMSSNSPSATTQSKQRKRPVAADFDAPSFTRSKRPFGQNRDDRPLVIDVSDDEAGSDDEDVAMDLDSQVDQDSPVQVVRTVAENRSITIHNLPPLSDFPARKPFTPPPSAIHTPPARQNPTKPTLGKPEDLQRKEKEIEEMKKKIAEAERRKRAKQTSSGRSTPRLVDNSALEAKSSHANSIASKVEASIQIEHSISVTESKTSQDKQRLAEAQVAEAEKAAELKRSETERKRMRREKIATDLPLVDAEVQQNQTKLEQLRAEMAKIEAAIQKDLADKQKMIEEREKLGQEAEEQLQEQRDKLRDLNGHERGISEGM